MKLMSMTGRGTGTAHDRRARVEVELSSVNRKQFDLALAWPRCLASFEARIQELVRGAISRGRVTGEIRLTWTGVGSAAPARINSELARAQVAALRAAARKLRLPDDLKASALLALPEGMTFERPAADIAATWPLVERALGAALAGLQAMRRKEGTALGRDLRARLKLLRKTAEMIRARAPAVAEAYREQLLRRLAEAVPATDWAADERVLKEVILFADRCDITEELVRMESHLQQAEALLRNGGVAGRALDFLVQELGREINTIGSKANDAEITRQVIAFKTELERIREQAQNIE